MRSPRFEPGSFRDRDGRVFYLDGVVHRGLGERAWADWLALSQARFFERATAAGKIVHTQESDLGGGELRSFDEGWVGALRHQRIPFVSYPYEWTFSMLRDAALLQLELLEGALGEGMTLKDCSSFNIQWLGSTPVFIDVASFQRRPEGEPWIGYLQFCQLFLYPLMLCAYKGIDFRSWLRGSLEGITPEDLARVMSARDLLRPGVFKHVYLQAKLRQRTRDARHSVRRQLQDAGFGHQLILNNVRQLRKLVAGLEWRPLESGWVSYAECNTYAESERREKEEFVRRAAARRHRTLAWDLGCNTGAFSRILSEHADYTVAIDSDPQVIDRLYSELAQEAEGKILALVNDLADPSPDRGWRGCERRALAERSAPDMVLGLALLHHMVIGANLPLAEVVEWFAGFGAEVVLEFVSKEDPMVARLLLNKTDQFDDYERAVFEDCLVRHFEIVDRKELSSGSRTLYHAGPRDRRACEAPVSNRSARG
jgi:precorrin-6B methylase 2